MLLSLSVGVIIDLPILWIYIQSNTPSWSEGRKYSFQVTEGTCLLLQMTWGGKRKMQNFWAEVIKYKGDTLPWRLLQK